jgi:hypothetical protein
MLSCSTRLLPMRTHASEMMLPRKINKKQMPIDYSSGQASGVLYAITYYYYITYN